MYKALQSKSHHYYSKATVLTGIFITLYTVIVPLWFGLNVVLEIGLMLIYHEVQLFMVDGCFTNVFVQPQICIGI